MSNTASRENLYMISIAALPQEGGIDLPKFIQKTTSVISNHSDITKIVYQFKVSCEPTLIFIVDIYNIVGVERSIAAICMQGTVLVECQPVISYESFARSIKVAGNLAQPSKDRLAKEGLYWLDFDVDYHGKTTEKLIKIWKKEAEAVFTARHKEGTSIELYKCVAQRKVHAFINAPSHASLDALTLHLPLMVENGENVQLKCKALQFLEDYVSYMGIDS